MTSQIPPPIDHCPICECSPCICRRIADEASKQAEECSICYPLECVCGKGDPAVQTHVRRIERKIAQKMTREDLEVMDLDMVKRHIKTLKPYTHNPSYPENARDALLILIARKLYNI